jgi:predicted alpha/beta-fold hydrolase
MGTLRHADFRPAWWAPGPHVQTLWPTLFRPRRCPDLHRERVELADGDFVDLAVGPGRGPTVLVIHGLEGDLRSHYAGGMIAALASEGFRPVFLYLRGRSGEPNRLARSYHSGATEDLAAVLEHLAGRPEGAAEAAVGFSLGGNLLLKYLGETTRPGLKAAVAISVPFLLRDAALRLNVGFARLYRRHLLRRLKDTYRAKFAGMPSPLDVDLEAIADLIDYDERVTAPLNGFAGAQDYYARCSCRPYLSRIETPTLVLHSVDDPFMFRHTVPREDELGRGLTLQLTCGGGHVGFVAGTLPWRPIYWAEVATLDWLKRKVRLPEHDHTLSIRDEAAALT